MKSSPRSAALLVGVDDYSAYDAEAGHQPGTSNLRGALQDVKAWYVAARALGIPADAIEVRTSPLLAAADMPIDATGTRFGPATREGLLDGVQKLGQALAGDVAQGLLTFSGHGATDSDGTLLLCPSDVTASLGRALSFPVLEQALDAVVPEHGLTVVLDTCHAGATGLLGGAFGRVGGRTLGSRAPAGTPLTAPALRAHDRILGACRASQNAREYTFQTVWHGAFTWALTSVLNRWGIAHDEGGIRYVGISYGELLTRAHHLLVADAFNQAPTFSGPDGEAAVPFAYPSGPKTAPDVTRPMPSPIEELDPGTDLGVYAITNVGGTILGYVVSVADEDVTIGGNTWKSKREYWCWTNGSPFPGTFVVKPDGTTPPSTISPGSATAVYESKPFPSSTGQGDPPNAGIWWSITWDSQSPTQAGWVNRYAASPQRMVWYEAASGQAPQWFTIGTNGPNLKFQQVQWSTVQAAMGSVSSVTDNLTTP